MDCSGVHEWDFFWIHLKWTLLSGISPGVLQLWMGAQVSPRNTNTVNMGSSAPTVSLCGTAVAVDKGRNLESLPSHLSEDCGSRRAVASWRIGVMLLQGTQMLFTSRASVPYICLIAEVVLTPSNRQTKYFILNGFRVAIFDRLNNRAFLN